MDIDVKEQIWLPNVKSLRIAVKTPYAFTKKANLTAK